MFSSLEAIANNLGIQKCPRRHEVVLIHLKVGNDEYQKAEFINEGRSRQVAFGDELRQAIFQAVPEATDYTFDVWSRHDYNAARNEAARIVRAEELSSLLRLMMSHSVMYERMER